MYLNSQKSLINVKGMLSNLTALKNKYLANDKKICGETLYRQNMVDFTYDYVSPAIVALTGISVREFKKIGLESTIANTIMATNGFTKIHSNEKYKSERLKNPTTKWTAHHKITTKNNEDKYIVETSYPWYDSNNKIIGFIGSLRQL